LDALYEVASENNCLLMVDDAHGEGVLGRGGRGIVDHYGLHGKVDVEVGTLSKAFGVVGGVVAGSQAIVDWLRQRARPFLTVDVPLPASRSKWRMGDLDRVGFDMASTPMHLSGGPAGSGVQPKLFGFRHGVGSYPRGKPLRVMLRRPLAQDCRPSKVGPLGI
jgi:hypothetical protein